VKRAETLNGGGAAGAAASGPVADSSALIGPATVVKVGIGSTWSTLRG
jgi:hypothetical protein